MISHGVVALQTDEQSWLIPIIILNLKHFNGMMIKTPHLPLVSVIRDGQFVHAHTNTSPNAQGVACIFDFLSLNDSHSQLPKVPWQNTTVARAGWI